jgi:AraC-like DNA-binding protein
MSIYPLYRSVLVNIASEEFLGIFLPILMPIFMLSGSILYLYVKNNLADQPHKLSWWKDGIHFIPSLISLVNLFPYMVLPMSEKVVLIRELIQNPNFIYNIPFLFFPNAYIFLIRPVLGIIYISICYYQIRQTKKRLSELNQELPGVNFKWLNLILTITLLNFISLVFMIYDFIFFRTTLDNNIMTLVAITFPMLCVVALNISILFFPSVMYGFINFKNNLKPVLFEDSTTELILNEDLIDEDARKTFKLVAEKLEIYFQSKPYLQPGFNLSTITGQTDLPYHKITSYFSVYLGINFNDWKNNARVDYAVDLINSGRAKNLTLESIASSCGFLSRSNFVNAFKKKMQMTPSEYVKALPNRDLVVNLNF